MQEANELSMQGEDNLADQVMDSLGEPSEKSDGTHSSDTQHMDSAKDELPLIAKERLGRQEKRHKKEMRVLQEQIQHLHNAISSNTSNPYNNDQSVNPYNSTSHEGSVEDHIQKAVNFALKQKDVEEQKAREEQNLQHFHKQYQNLQEKLDNASDKYEDFDEVVRRNDVPFTKTIRDAMLILPHDNAADVAYKLAKNRTELQRISSLHPLEQAREVLKLSVALKGGNDQASSAHKPLGHIKNNPVSSHGISESTSISDLRKKMKAGWK